MTLSFNPKTNAFILTSNDEERANAVGLTLSTRIRGSKGEKVWYTADKAGNPAFNPYAALPFWDVANGDARNRLDSMYKDYSASWADSCDLDFPAPKGKEYMPYQKAGISYALDHHNCLVGDEPGLGKTIQAIGIANAIEAQRVLVICPASIRLNWQREIREWSTLKRVSTYPILKSGDGVNPYSNFVIISYDLASRDSLYAALHDIKWDLMILDEGHYLKSLEAKRTRAIFGGGRGLFQNSNLAEKAHRIVALTGTPLPNRPRECLGSSTMVLTNSGWKRMIDVSINDLLWDGEEWVNHEGVLYQGCEKTVNVAGISATKSHLFLGRYSWVSAEEVAQNMGTLRQVLERGSKNLPSSVSISQIKKLSKALECDADVEQNHSQLRYNACGQGGLRDVEVVEPLKGGLRFWPTTVRFALTTPREPGYYRCSPMPCKGVTTPTTGTISLTGVGVSKFMDHGDKTGYHSLNTWLDWITGTHQESSWIELTTKKDTSQGILDGQPIERICKTEELYTKCSKESKSLKPVYDIANAGPRRRFTILSDQGPVISHNCYTLARAMCWESIDWASYDDFTYRYNPSGRVSSGFNLEKKGRLPELQARLRSNFMVRRLKKDVLKDLPDKRYEFTYIEPNKGVRSVLAKEKFIDFDPGVLMNPDFKLDGAVATVRREMGEAMVPLVVDHIKFLLDIVEIPKIVMFAHHRSVMDALIEALHGYGLVISRGGMGNDRKQQSVDLFGSDPDVRLFLGQLDTMEGVNGLQSVADHCVFAEPAWTPGRNEQCVDRLHRHGQHGNVVAQFLLAEGSFNEKVLGSVLEKAQDIFGTLDSIRI